jgi:hypothetical protein
MGWASGSEIFDTVAHAMIEEGLNEESIENISVRLIQNLQGNDWDTEDESLSEFLNVAPIVKAFARCGIGTPPPPPKPNFIRMTGA